MAGAKISTESQKFLDTHQYSQKSILKYERIFGHTWVSTGGLTTTKEFCLWLDLKPGQKVLDIGCGTGGSAFYLARQYGVQVDGMDLSKNMIDIAQERLFKEENTIKNRVSFSIGDITTVNYDSATYDVVYSRDTILHIADKEALFRRMAPWLKEGGKLLISDYCRGDQEHSNAFKEYVKQRGYDLRTVSAYGKVLQSVGFRNVEATDMSKYFLDILQNELRFFEPCKEAFIQDFSQADYDDISKGWTSKMGRVKAGDQAWGLFKAIK